MALLFLATLALSIGVELGFSALRKGLLWGKKRWRAPEVNGSVFSKIFS